MDGYLLNVNNKMFSSRDDINMIYQIISIFVDTNNKEFNIQLPKYIQREEHGWTFTSKTHGLKFQVDTYTV